MLFRGECRDAENEKSLSGGDREQIVALARAGRSVEELAREFEPCAHTMHGWIRQAERDGGSRTDGLTSEEREELRRLRR
ncbi:transposase [Acuticoccus yangtzensis]|uniref:transposase n=1 Tax=Acuticoccus yangtzensis TaxID=1443441 RepID=UPI000A533590|nr:transposase [Acuticoccus yangtzensis]